MSIDKTTLNVLCPMHVVLDPLGTVEQAGPTLQKLRPDVALTGMRFLDILEVYRPRAITDFDTLRRAAGRKLHMRFRDEPHTRIKGLLMPDHRSGGAVMNLSFGIAVTEAVRDYQLTSADFAVTDLAVEMLYLVEAKSAAMQASRKLNERLQIATLAAEERAFTDKLTGLGNRRAMDVILERMAANDDPFALMHVDLDFFKEVNDTHGHAAGDRVLQHIADTMRAVMRKEDVITRVGGDEFVILLKGVMQEERLAGLAEHLIQQSEVPVRYNDQSCRVSSSIGIAIRQSGVRLSPEAVLEQADQALYASKRAGRARYSFFDAKALGQDTATFPAMEFREATGGG